MKQSVEKVREERCLSRRPSPLTALTSIVADGIVSTKVFFAAALTPSVGTDKRHAFISRPRTRGAGGKKDVLMVMKIGRVLRCKY